MKEPLSLKEAVLYFSDSDVAHKQFTEVRWPNGIACPRPGCESHDVRAISRRRWRCGNCKKDFTAKLGTIFEDSALGLDKWLPTIWWLANAKNGTSSVELHRALGITQKTAWFMLHRVRTAMKLRTFEKERDDLDVDESFAEGKPKRSRTLVTRPKRKQARRTRP